MAISRIYLLVLFVFICFIKLASAQPYDLVVALGGGDERKVKAIELLNQGEAHTILFTGESDTAAAYAHWKVNGILPDLIAKNTREDFVVIKHEMEKYHFSSVEIVDSDYHVSESKLFAKIMFPHRYKVHWVVVKREMSFRERFALFFARLWKFLKRNLGQT